MRKNVIDAMKAWAKGKANGYLGCKKTVWTDGDVVYSWRTAIMTVKDGTAVLNTTYYSRTTNAQVRSVRLLLECHEYAKRIGVEIPDSKRPNRIVEHIFRTGPEAFPYAFQPNYDVDADYIRLTVDWYNTCSPAEK